MSSASTKSTQYDISTMTALNKKVMHHWESLLKQLGIEDYQENNSCITSCCSIHGGDNTSALNLYIEGCDTFPGLWTCNTHQCQDIFGRNIIGFTRGMLSRNRLQWSMNGDDTVSFPQTVEYLLSFLKTDYMSLKPSSTSSKSSSLFTQQVNQIFARQNNPENQGSSRPSRPSRQDIRSALSIPSSYYIQKGYSPEILNVYDVGECDNPTKPMRFRVVVPVYDKDNCYIGCTGRSVYDKCEECGQYHAGECQYKSPKWLHSKGFKGAEHLYNYNNAKTYIKESQIAIIVEGPADVWRLEESGIHNSVCLFGTALSQGQFNLLNSSGALSIIVLLDNDEAGKKGAAQLQRQLGRLYRMYYPTFEKNDVGELTKDEITKDISVYLDRIQN